MFAAFDWVIVDVAVSFDDDSRFTKGRPAVLTERADAVDERIATKARDAV